MQTVSLVSLLASAETSPLFAAVVPSEGEVVSQVIEHMIAPTQRAMSALGSFLGDLVNRQVPSVSSHILFEVP